MNQKNRGKLVRAALVVSQDARQRNYEESSFPWDLSALDKKCVPNVLSAPSFLNMRSLHRAEQSSGGTHS